MTRPLWRRCLAAILGSRTPAVEHVHPPLVEYVIQIRDGGRWTQIGAPYAADERPDAVDRITSRQPRYPDTEHRILRRTTTYTVEPS